MAPAGNVATLSGPRKRRPAADPAASHEILVVSARGRAAAVERSLSALRLSVRHAAWSDSVPAQIRQRTVAMMLVMPLPRISYFNAVARIRGSAQGALLPLLATVPARTPESSVRKLYTAGATAVFHWPRDSFILPGVVAELLALDQVHGHARRPDTALARLVLSRLRLDPGLSRGITVECRDGAVHLGGSTESLWRKHQAEETASQVPGVRRVVSSRLVVLPSGRTDRQVERDIRNLIESASSIDGATLSVKVQNGAASLAGTVSDRAELRRLLDLIANLKGVRALHNLTTIWPRQRAKDSAVARALEKRLEAALPGNRIELSVFGGVGVLSGKAGSLTVRRAAERILEEENAIERIINKIEVKP